MIREAMKIKGDMFAEDKEYRICGFHSEDRAHYEKLWGEIPVNANTDEEMDKKMLEQSWWHIFDDEDMCKYKIVEKATSSFVGSIEIRDLDEEAPELGIQLLKKYQGRGIGTNVMGLFLRTLGKLLPGTEYTVKIRSDNEVSQHMFQKLGAVECGKEGLGWVELYQSLANTLGKEHFEKMTGMNYEASQRYIVCYKIAPWPEK